MSFNILSISRSPLKPEESLAKLHVLAKQIELGSPDGRIYLALEKNSLKFSTKWSEEVPKEVLDKFIKKKLKWRSKEQVNTSTIDLNIIKKDREALKKFNMSTDLFRTLFGFLETSDVLCHSAVVSKDWHKQIFSNNQLIKKLIKSTVRGPEKWMNVLNVGVDIAPKLSEDYYSTLMQPSPYWPSKKKIDTHFHAFFIPTVLDPGTSKERPMTINNFLELIKNKVGNLKLFEDQIWEEFLRVYGNIPFKKAMWIEMTKNTVPLTAEEEDYKKQVALVEAEPDYHPAKLLLITVCFLFDYAVAVKEKKDVRNRASRYSLCKDRLYDRQVAVNLQDHSFGIYFAHTGVVAMRQILCQEE